MLPLYVYLPGESSKRRIGLQVSTAEPTLPRVGRCNAEGYVEDVLHAGRVVVAHALDAVGKDLVDGLAGLDEPLAREQVLLDAGHLHDPDR